MIAAYTALEKLLADGSVRAIGVSNFMRHHLDDLAARTEVVPAVNQVELHPYFSQPDVQAADAERGTLTQAGSALKASMLRDLEAGQQVEAEQIVGDMLARARKADQEALLLQVAYSSLQAYQALRGA